MNLAVSRGIRWPLSVHQPLSVRRSFAPTREASAAFVSVAGLRSSWNAARGVFDVNELAKICSGENYLAPLKGSRKLKRETDSSTSDACIFFFFS